MLQTITPQLVSNAMQLAPTSSTVCLPTLTTTSQEAQTYLMKFSPSNQADFVVNNYDRCFTGKAKTLSQIDADFGKGASLAWLVAQLLDLSEYFGGKGKLSEAQLLENAKVIYSKYYFLKLTELMVFFLRFKQGEYGEFFGSADPIKIMTALKSFLNERATTLDRIASEERKKEREEHAKSAVSYEEYKRKYEGKTI